jgi:hypothetical protein
MGECWYHHLYKPHPSLDLSAGLGLRLWGSQCLNLRKIGGCEKVSRGWVVVLIVICTGLNGAGFLWNLFEPIPLYDEIAHFITPFTLVMITAEIIYRAGGDDEFFSR